MWKLLSQKQIPRMCKPDIKAHTDSDLVCSISVLAYPERSELSVLSALITPPLAAEARFQARLGVS